MEELLFSHYQIAKIMLKKLSLKIYIENYSSTCFKFKIG